MLVVAVAFTVLAVAWTGWVALRDLERVENVTEREPEMPRALLRLVEPVATL